jgi:serine/threonine protein kinase
MHQTTLGGEGAAPGTATAAAWPVVAWYEVGEVLGRGGMGVVYRARQKGVNRSVALKVLRSGIHARAEERVRFRAEAEAEALGRLHHPNVVQVYEAGSDRGFPFLAMELVEGGDLKQRLAAGPLAADQAAWLVETLARAMHFVHRRGILHRDLKPANILLANPSPRPPPLQGEGESEHSCSPLPAAERGAGGEGLGTPKITDFGLARRLDVPADLTQSGELLGTPSYMAPEQTRGNPEEVGVATDVYAMGAILYEALTGRPPFQGRTPLDTLDQVRFQEPLPPTQLNGAVPGALAAICLKCLRKQARQRYAGANQLADDLRRFRQGEDVLGRPAGPGRWLARWCLRLAAVVFLGALLVLAAGSSRRGNGERPAGLLPGVPARQASREPAQPVRPGRVPGFFPPRGGPGP